MSEITPLSPEEIARLQERTRKLALDKSYFQLIINLMSKVSAAQGLDNMIEVLLKNIIGIIGGTNIILYYLIDKDLYYADILGKRMKIDRIDDVLVQQVFEHCEPIEQENDFCATGLMTPEFNKAYTWIFPLMTGHERIGVFKFENLNLDMHGFYDHLPVFFTHVASVLKNEVQGQTQLKQAYDKLSQINSTLALQVKVRIQAEEDLRLARDQLQERVEERTLDLRLANERLQHELAERIRAEEALQSSEGNLRSLFNAIQESVCLFDRNEKIIAVNATFAARVNKSPEECIGQSIYSLVPPDVADRRRVIIDEVFRTGTPSIFEDERQGYCLFHSIMPVLNPEGFVDRIALFAMDITKRKQQESSLRLQSMVLDQISDHVTVTDLQGNITYVNDAEVRLLKRKREELIGCHISAYGDDPAKGAAQQEILDRTLNTGYWRGEVVNITEDGSKILLDCRTQVVQDENGKVVALCGISRDITERRRLEKVQAFLAQTSSGPQDKPFFDILAQYLAQCLGMDFVCIDRLDGDGLTARTVSVWCDGRFEDNVSYALKDTPCGEVVGQVVCCFRASVSQFFPRDQILQDLRAESYVGVTLWSHTGQPIGLIAVIGRKPLANSSQIETILKLVAVRAAGELERLNAEAALRESLQRNEALLNAIPDMIFVFSHDGLIVDARVDNFDDLYTSPANFLGKNIRDVLPPDIAQQTYDRIAETQQTNRLVQYNYTLELQGEQKDYECRLVPCKNGTFMALVRDITERKRAEVALQVAQIKYKTLFDYFPMGITVTNDKGEINESNPIAEMLLGVPQEKHYQRMIDGAEWYLIRPDGSLMPSEEFASVRALREKCTVKNVEMGIVKPDDTVTWLNVTATPLPLEGYGVVITYGDITERRQADTALRESEDKFTRVFRDAPVLIAITDLDSGVYIDVNEEAIRVSGFTREEIIGHTAIELGWIKAADRELMVQLLQTHDRIVGLEVAFCTKDGKYLVGMVNAEQIVIGGKSCLLTVSIDITERKQIELDLAARRRELEILHRISEIALTDLPLHTLLQDIVQETSVALNFPIVVVEYYDEEEQVMEFAATVGMALPPGNEPFKVSVSQTLSGIVVRSGQPLIEMHAMDRTEYAFEPLRKFGVQTFVCAPMHVGTRIIGTLSLASSCVLQLDERTLALACSLANLVATITERKRTEEAIHENNELFSLFMHHSPIYTYIHSVTPTESRIVQGSDNFRQITGLSDEEMKGKTMTELFPAEFASKVTGEDWSVISKNEVLKIEEELNGRFYTTIKFPIVQENKTLVAGYSIDITDSKRAEEEKARLEAQLQQAQKMESVGRLAGGVAHDFNNMLQVILNHTDVALLHVDPKQPLHEDLEEIRKAAERSADLTRQLLAFARKQTVAPRVLDVNETVSGLTKMLKRLIGEDIDLAWMPGSSVWPIKVDPSQIDQILANLCVNARDAIADVGKITIETGNKVIDADYCAEHPGYIPGAYVQLAISDNGCGMDKDMVSNIFEPFFTTKAVGEGTGLGLATVYGIVKQNNGFINVYSEPGKGTTFSIYLPRYTGKSVQAQTDDVDEPVMHGHDTILLVEDELVILKGIKRILESFGYQVIAASTPGEAIHLAREHVGDIHLLITDVVMPEMNGRDLAKNLLALYPNLKRLFMSGYTANVIAHHGVLDEGVHFIQKPFSTQNLAVKVREVLGDESGGGS